MPTTIKKAFINDFKLIYPLLQKFDNTNLKKSDWQQLFTNPFKSPKDYIGYVMIDEDRAVGFQGLLFSQRKYKGKTMVFCNMTSWIVEESYRGKSIFLLLPVLKHKEYTFTDLTPTKDVSAVLKKARFKVFETKHRMILPFIAPGKIKMRKIKNSSIIKDEAIRKVMIDHRRPSLHGWQVSSPSGSFFLLTSKIVRSKPPFIFARIHWVSHADRFQKYVSSIACKFLTQFGMLAIDVDERYLGGKKIAFSFQKTLECPRLFRSPFIDAWDIDTLYSESLIINF